MADRPESKAGGVTELLTEQQWAERMRTEREVKDKTYRKWPIGQEVGRFLRTKRLEGCQANTLLSYETTLCRFTLDHRDIDSLEHFASPEGAELIVEFLAEHWGDSAASTLDNRTAALKSFFSWAADVGRISREPRLKRRRGGGAKVREAHSLDEIHLIVAAQDEIADEVALLLMGRLAFRKDDIRLFQVRDVDLAHDRVFIRRGKGVKPVELPIAFAELRDALKLWLSAASSADEYLWHPTDRPLDAPDPATVHRRFKRCLERAGVPDFPMHELRHSAGDRLWRTTGDLLAANQLLRHASLDQTKRYLHPTQEDLRARLLLSDRDED